MKKKLVICFTIVFTLICALPKYNINAASINNTSYEEDLIKCLIEKGELEDKDYVIETQNVLTVPEINLCNTPLLSSSNINAFQQYDVSNAKEKTIILSSEDTPDEMIYIIKSDLDTSTNQTNGSFDGDYRDFEKQSNVYVIARAHFANYRFSANNNWNNGYRPVSVTAKWTTLNSKKSAYVETLKAIYQSSGLYYDTTTWKTVSSKFYVNKSAVSQYLPDEGVFYAGNLTGMPTNRAYLKGDGNGIDTYSHIYLYAKCMYNGKSSTIEATLPLTYSD